MSLRAMHAPISVHAAAPAPPPPASGVTHGAVCAADYELPATKPVSEECKDILSRILVVDPAQRINIAEIQASCLSLCASNVSGVGLCSV